MKVQLVPPTPLPGAEAPAPGPAQEGSAPLVPARAPAAGLSPLDRLARLMTGWPAVGASFLLCGAFLCWSLGVRLPNNARLLAVHARGLKPIEILGRPVSLQEVAALRKEAAVAARFLLERPQELGPRISELERKGRELGWRVEISTPPAQPKHGGYTPVTRHPVLVRLEDEAELPDPAFRRLLTWLRSVSSLTQRVEVASLQLRCAGAGLVGAQLELHFFSLEPHEATSTK
jgi:hypothetical protein